MKTYLWLLLTFGLWLAWIGGLHAEPSVQEVQRQALFYARVESGTEQSWKKRASWQAAVPQLRFTVQRDLDEQLRVTNKDNVSISGGDITIGPDEQDVLRDFDAGTRVQVTAVWYLDRLVFNRDEILVSQERRRRNEERQELLAKVTKLYFERRHALDVLGQKRRLSAAKRQKLNTIVLERTALLDALTGGWFGQCLE